MQNKCDGCGKESSNLKQYSFPIWTKIFIKTDTGQKIDRFSRVNDQTVRICPLCRYLVSKYMGQLFGSEGEIS